VKRGNSPPFSTLRAVACLAVIAVMAGVSGACVEIDGGAIEISWLVRSTAGSPITDCGCAEPQIAAVRLVVTGRGGSLEGATPCAGEARCDFPCQRRTGSTAFDIEQTDGLERYEISVVAVGLDGQEISKERVMTPAPILREVVHGQPTEVEAFQLVAPCRTECVMNGSGVCARP
jgi:hypothetical protein